MPDANYLRILPPPDSSEARNQLSPWWGKPVMDAATGWMARQHAQSQAAGLEDPATGLPTSLGIRSALAQIPNALVMGTSAPGIRAFHGSPYDFNAFDSSKIGTGEGAQAYGHGLYFAENEGVARSYRDANADRQLIFKNDETAQLHAALPDHLRQQYRSDIEAGRDPRVWLNNVADGAQRHAEYVQSGGRASVNYGPDGGFELASTAKQLAEQPLPQTKSAGSMYEVSLNADPEHFLDWDKPLSEQSDHVQDAVGYKPPPSVDEQNAMIASLKAKGVPPEQVANQSEYKAMEAQLDASRQHSLPNGERVDATSAPGATLYHALTEAHAGDPAAAAQKLRDAGIPGIRYLDQGSRAQGEGTSNYVVFDPATIEILRKYGIAGLMAGTGAAAAQDQ